MFSARTAIPLALQDEVASIHFFTAGDGASMDRSWFVATSNVGPAYEALDLLMLCVVFMCDGRVLVGRAMADHPSDFDEDEAMEAALDDALQDEVLTP